MLSSDDKNFFRDRRVELGLTQRAVAIALGVTENSVNRWERGRGLPRVQMLDQLATVYKVETDQIVSELMKLAKRCTQPA